MIEVYIDGSSKENPGPGGAGIVIKNAAIQELLSTHGIPLGHVTNNQAEFLALKHALMELKRRCLLELAISILTDSQLVVGIFSQNWKARANLELVREIRGLVKEFPQLTFAYVRGHNGNPGNELADSLAQNAAETQKGNEEAFIKVPVGKSKRNQTGGSHDQQSDFTRQSRQGPGHALYRDRQSSDKILPRNLEHLDRPEW